MCFHGENMKFIHYILGKIDLYSDYIFDLMNWKIIYPKIPLIKSIQIQCFLFTNQISDVPYDRRLSRVMYSYCTVLSLTPHSSHFITHKQHSTALINQYPNIPGIYHMCVWLCYCCIQLYTVTGVLMCGVYDYTLHD